MTVKKKTTVLDWTSFLLVRFESRVVPREHLLKTAALGKQPFPNLPFSSEFSFRCMRRIESNTTGRTSDDIVPSASLLLFPQLNNPWCHRKGGAIAARKSLLKEYKGGVFFLETPLQFI